MSEEKVIAVRAVLKQAKATKAAGVCLHFMSSKAGKKDKHVQKALRDQIQAELRGFWASEGKGGEASLFGEAVWKHLDDVLNLRS
eukprot:3936939-Amphidinium_carterae.1